MFKNTTAITYLKTYSTFILQQVLNTVIVGFSYYFFHLRMYEQWYLIERERESARECLRESEPEKETQRERERERGRERECVRVRERS